MKHLHYLRRVNSARRQCRAYCNDAGLTFNPYIDFAKQGILISAEALGNFAPWRVSYNFTLSAKLDFAIEIAASRLLTEDPVNGSINFFVRRINGRYRDLGSDRFEFDQTSVEAKVKDRILGADTYSLAMYLPTMRYPVASGCNVSHRYDDNIDIHEVFERCQRNVGLALYAADDVCNDLPARLSYYFCHLHAQPIPKYTWMKTVDQYADAIITRLPASLLEHMDIKRMYARRVRDELKRA